jgi:hypothetical protein
MQELEKKVTGDWFDIKEKAENIFDLHEQFTLSVQQLRSLIQEIRLSVEGGVLEYKRKVVNPVFPFLEALKYDSKHFDELGKHAASLTPLIYGILIQRLIARGAVPIKKKRVALENEREKGLKAIITDINERIQDDPSLSNNPAVKNIMNYMNVYKRELTKMNELAPNIPPEKKESFAANFKHTFDELTESIQDNYARVVQEEQQKVRDKIDVNPLERYDIKVLAKPLLNQAMEISRVRSTLRFAAKEGFKTRELLAKLTGQKEQITAPIEEEWRRYLELTDGDEGRALIVSKSFGGEIIRVLERQTTRLTEYPGGPAPSAD